MTTTNNGISVSVLLSVMSRARNHVFGWLHILPVFTVSTEGITAGNLQQLKEKVRKQSK